MGKLRSKRVIDHAAFLSEGHEPGDSEHAQSVRDGVFSGTESQRQVTDAEPIDAGQCKQDPGTHRISEESEQAGQAAGIVSRDQVCTNICESVGINWVFAVRVRCHKVCPSIRMIVRMLEFVKCGGKAPTSRDFC
jgi:hypothetical protein